MPREMKNFVVNGEEKSVQDTLSKLKFIAKIKPGEKIDVENMMVQEVSPIISFIRTFFRNDSRQRTITFARTTYGEAFELVEEYTVSDNSHFNKNLAKKILDTVVDSQTGLKNLMKTYEDDTMFIAKVETILDMIEIKLKQFTSEKSKVK